MKFFVGQNVKRNSYTDCFGIFHPERFLIVEKIYPQANHIRVKAVLASDPWQYEDASQDFFTALTINNQEVA
jgi:hypothetical protein